MLSNAIKIFKPFFIIKIAFFLPNNFSSTSLTYKNTESSILLKRQKRKPDRFGIEKSESIEKLIDLFQTPKFTLTLNENILICYQITKLAPVHVLKSICGLSEILPKILCQISDVNLIEEDPLIGSLMYSLKILSCNKNINSWIHLQDLIMADCFDSDADEVLKAMQGIDGLEFYLKEDWQKELYNSAFLKIEMMLIEHLKTMKYDLKNLRNICQILNKNNRRNPEVFEEIEFQINKFIQRENKNLEEEKKVWDCTLEDMIIFSYLFSKAEYNSPNLFSLTNNMLLKEILESNKKNEKELNFILKGSEIANLMYLWHFYQSKEISFDLDENIKKWVFENSLHESIDYTIEDLIEIHNGLSLLEIKNEKLGILIKHLEKKLLKIEINQISKLNLSYIEKYFRLRAEIEFKNDYNQISDEIFRFFDNLCFQTYTNFHYLSVHNFYRMLEANHILNRFPNFYSVLPKFIESHSFLYEFDDVCYFYLLLISNTSLLSEEKSGEFYSALNNLKEFIKFVALRRGFKMDMDSNFHKMLSAIDLANFFEGGEG